MLEDVVTRQAATSHGRTEFEAVLVHVKAYNRDKGRHARPSCFISYAWSDETHRQWVSKLARDLRNGEVEVVFDQWENLTIGASLTDFVDRVDTCDFIAIIGTPGVLCETPYIY